MHVVAVDRACANTFLLSSCVTEACQLEEDQESWARQSTLPAGRGWTRANQGSEISGDDDAHDACECDHPYRRRCSPFSIRVHLGVHNTSGATRLVARGCPLTSSLSQEGASVDQDWSGTDESSLFSPLVMVSSSFFPIVSPPHSDVVARQSL